MTDKVPNAALLKAALLMMRSAGMPMERVPTKTRAMKYKLANGETVRVRTCNDHVLVVLADTAEPGAALNIEGTDHLLIVMPAVPRQKGDVITFFVPVAVAVAAVRQAHAEWLDSQPSTKGNNRTWNIWFSAGAGSSGGFALKWSKYRVDGYASTLANTPVLDAIPSASNRPLGMVIADARQEIAKAAGVSLQAVKISVVLD